MRIICLLFATLQGLMAQPLTMLPKQEQVPCGQTIQFRVPGYRVDELIWRCDRGSINVDGLFTAPGEFGPCRIAVQDRQDVNRSASIIVRCVSVSFNAPSDIFIRPREEGRVLVDLQFHGGEFDRKLVWTWSKGIEDEKETESQSPAPRNVPLHDGKLDETGWFRAPSTEGIYAIRITLAGDPRASKTTYLRVVPSRSGRVNGEGQPVMVRVQPDKIELQAGNFTWLNASTSGAELEHVLWSLVEGSKDCEVFQEGGFRATRPGRYRIRATSFVYPECWGEAEVTVTSPVNPVKEEEAAKANRLGIAIVPGPQATYLFLGGWDGEQVSAEVLLHDSIAGTVQSRGALQIPRARALAVPLFDGTILVVGGVGGKGGNTPLQEAERLDPERKVSWRVGTPRWFHIGGLLQPLPGGGALLVGGQEPNGQPCGAESYDPATATFRTLDDRPWPTHAASVRLKDGRVLILGGELNQKPVAPLWSFDPAKESFTPIGKLAQARSRFTATLLWDDKSLVAIGGRGVKGALAAAERLDLATGRSNPAGRMPAPRERHAAILLPTGQVLVFGGGDGAKASRLMEDWIPDSSTFQTRSQMDTGAWLPVLFLNPDGNVFVHGHPADRFAKAPLPGIWRLWD